LNDQLHQLIYDGARNHALKDIAVNLRQRLTPFRSRVFFTTDNRMQASYQEHSELIGAILAHDGEAAARSMLEHAARSAMNALGYFKQVSAQRARRQRAG